MCIFCADHENIQVAKGNSNAVHQIGYTKTRRHVRTYTRTVVRRAAIQPGAPNVLPISNGSFTKNRRYSCKPEAIC